MSLFRSEHTLTAACLLGAALCLLPSRNAQANVTLLDKDDWKLMMGGFVELDAITDSTRSFREVIGNAPVSVSGATGGDGRTQFSIRNTRLGFTVEAPQYEGWNTKGYMEFDFLGYDTQNTADNSTYTTANQSESSFFTSPTLRIRHAYMEADKDGYQVLAGQYWNLIGWQPYYFMGNADVSPLPGMLYSRNPQLRGLKAIHFGEQDVLQIAAALVRPPQEDSRLPSLEAGARFAMGERSSGFTGGATGGRATQPMSIAVSGTAREFSLPTAGTSSAATNSVAGYALAADTMIPIIASPDGKSVENTLSLLAEYTVRGFRRGRSSQRVDGGFGQSPERFSCRPGKRTAQYGRRHRRFRFERVVSLDACPDLQCSCAVPSAEHV